MELSYNWLLQYLPQPIAIDTLSKILTSIGLEVEQIEKFEAIKGSLEGLVIGEVLTCVPHPNADKLRLTTVAIGNDTILNIVCGAPNVAAGQKVIVATVGTTVYPTEGAPFEIKKAKIRGELSEGMICADDEIGLGTNHDGIKVLPPEVTVGTLANTYFDIPAPDYTISIGLTPNRSDANAHLGVAKDVCAYQSHYTGKPWKVVLPTIPNTLLGNNALSIDIDVEDKEACPLYTGLCIQNVQVAESPEWLQQSLRAIGQRPINNIVDITNYVLHETGQPLHAFDYDTIAQHKIIVKKLAEGTTFKTLDGVDRTLRAADLMINDAQKPLAMAGIFGGHTSGVHAGTTNIFLESAYFDPKTIRRASMHHGLRTDAATHFEKSVDIAWVIPALKRAAQLIIDIAGGTVASNIISIAGQDLTPREISVSLDYINAICGKNFTIEAVIGILEALDFTILENTNTSLTVKVPSNKADVHQAADIAEEILRIDGLDNIPVPNTVNIALNTRTSPISRKWKERLANHLTGLGFSEIITNSISNSKYYPQHENRLVKMLNSLTSELDCLRPSILESGLEVLSYNINRKQTDLRLYEIGNIYSTTAVGAYQQQQVLAIWLTGQLSDQHWNVRSQKVDLFYAKGIVESLLRICGVHKYQVLATDGNLSWTRGKDTIATLGLAAPSVTKAFDIKQEVYFIEINIETLLQAIGNSQKQIKYKELPKYPAMKRDLAVIVDKNTSYEKLVQVVQKQKLATLQNFDLFDVFESEKIGNDKKSLALSFTFLNTEKTLTDAEVDAMMQQLIVGFEKDIAASIRQ